MSLLGGIGKALGGVGKLLGGLGKALGGIASLITGVMGSPLGKLLALAFPPLGLAQGAMSLFGMMGGLANGIGGGQNY